MPRADVMWTLKSTSLLQSRAAAAGAKAAPSAATVMTSAMVARMRANVTSGGMRTTLLALALVLAMTAPAGAATRLVRYDVAGGLRGIHNRLVVDRDGSARQSGDTTRRFDVSDTQLRRLKRELEAARFGSLKRSYRPKAPVSDGITQSVRYKGFEVDISTGADVPDRLARVLRRLGGLMR